LSRSRNYIGDIPAEVAKEAEGERMNYFNEEQMTRAQKNRLAELERKEAKIKVKQPEKPIEQPTETKPEGEKPAVVEVKEKPTKKTYNRQPKETKYPVALFVNAYGFIRISYEIRRDLEWGDKGEITNLTADKNADGSLTIRKA